MAHKPRRFDLSPDNFIAGISGELTADELGLYWLICLLIYSNGGPVEYDEARFCRLLKNTHWRTIRKASERLQELRKITVSDGHVMAKGCAEPLQEAVNRVSKAVENGFKGGRPKRENNDLAKPDAFHGEKLARVAPSPSPPPSRPEDIPSLREGAPKPRSPKSKRSLPEAFPLQADRTWAENYWIQKGRADLCALMGEEIEKFRDHHAGKLTASADWPGSWRTWCRNAMKFQPKGRAAGHDRKNTALDTFLGAGASIIRDIEREERAQEGAGDDAWEAGRPLLPS